MILIVGIGRGHTIAEGQASQRTEGPIGRAGGHDDSGQAFYCAVIAILGIANASAIRASKTY